jgi:curved DNA-binding protein CbpA
MSGPNHYEVLGVAPDASVDDIRAAYRRAARDQHPDAGGEAAEMQRLNAAWQVLRDPARRAVYDRALANRGQGIDGVAAPSTGVPPDPGADWSMVDEELLDPTPYGPTAALEGWWALLPPATLLLAIALLMGAVLFTSPALLVLAAGAAFLAFGLFVLASLRAMTRRPPTPPSVSENGSGDD